MWGEYFTRKRALLVLLVILILAAGLRIYQLDQESFWTDESFSVHHAEEKTFTDLAIQVSQTEAAPFGYYTLLHYWIAWWGDSELAVRSLSVIFGVLSVLVLYLIAASLFSRKVALLSCLFMATSMIQVLYSQEARLYSLFTLLSLLATYFFIKLLAKSNETNSQSWRGYDLLYFLTMLAALYTNYLAIFLIFIYTIILLWDWPNSKPFLKKWFLIHLILFLLCLPLLGLMKAQFASIGTGTEQVYLQKGVPLLLAKLGLFMFALPMALITLLLLFAFLFRQKIKNVWESFSLPRTGLVILIILFGAIYLYLCVKPLTIFGLPLFKSTITNSYFLIRHSLFLAPLLYVFFGCQLAKVENRKIAALLLAFILVVNAVALTVYYSQPTKTEWQEAADFIESHSSHRPIILLDKGGPSNEFLLDYYLNSDPILIKLTWSEEERKLERLSEEDLLSMIQKAPDFWLVLSRNSQTLDYYREMLDKRFTSDQAKLFYQVKVYHYVNNPNFLS